MKLKIKKSRVKIKSKVKICDSLWSELVKKCAGYKCEICGTTTYLQSHHIIPRTCYSLRHDWNNGVCLCRRHHLFFAHKDALAFAQWVQMNRDIEYLESRRNSQSKNDYSLIEIYLRNELREV